MTVVNEKQKKATKARENKEKVSMEVVFILDRSGSMSGLEQDTIGGFNSMLEKQRKSGNDIIWSTVLFDDEVEVIHDRIPVKQVGKLTNRQYYVRGMTALLDAVGDAIRHTVSVRRSMKKGTEPDKTLFVITTDGMENSSIKYSFSDVKKMIRHEQKKYGWEFMFLGSTIDAAAEAERIGIRRDFSAQFIHDNQGMKTTYGAVGCVMEKMMACEALDGSELDCAREDYNNRKDR